ncbi:MAG: DUF6263 family protein [Planctomycetaceae bacterium]
MLSIAASLLAPIIVLSAPDDAATEKVQPSEPVAYELKYKFKKGDSVFYAVSHSTNTTSQLAQQKQVITERVRERKHIVVTETADDGSFVLQTVFDHVVMEADMGSKKVRFDSKKPPKHDPPGFGAFRKKIEKPRFQVQIKPSGALIAIRRLAAAGSSSAESAGKSGDGSSFLVVFPDRPLKVGTTWREDYSVRLPMTQEIVRKITIMRTYRLNSVKDGVAHISFGSSLKTPVKDPAVLAKLVQSTPSGTVEFDIEAGQIVKRTMKVDEMVLNHSGPQSMLKTSSRRIEKRVAPREATEVSKEAATAE